MDFNTITILGIPLLSPTGIALLTFCVLFMLFLMWEATDDDRRRRDR